MAAVTPKEILAISETLEGVYQRTTDELLINISKHFATDTALRTRWWEIKKLSELGALTEESVQIIARNTGIAPAEIRKAFLAVAEKACLDIDPQLKDAAAQGFLQSPGTEVVTSPAMQSILQSYIRQSVDRCNLVNTTMLQSTQAAYRKAVADTVMMDAQLSKAQDILNSATGALVTHTDTRQQAIRRAMNQMSDAGLTGFYDRAGRKWSPEAYVAMDIRTTAHNVAIDAIKTRQAEYGSDIFQVSAHAGARPLCYPYQNKFYSWGGSGGTFPDGNGDLHTYEPVSSTSYGEAAGLFGINCGHHPRVVIPCMTIPHDVPAQDETANKKEYEESQQQRALERKIREAKRKEEIAKASKDGDAEAARARVKGAQTQMRQFISDTGRQRRYDREQVGSSSQQLYSSGSGGKMALTGAKKTPGWETRHAEQYYEETRKRTSDVAKIAASTPFTQKAVQEIKNHIFSDAHLFRDGSVRRFDSDYDQAQAWERLQRGEGTELDTILLKHEYVELAQMRLHNYCYEDAHDIANKRYDWAKALLEKEGK